MKKLTCIIALALGMLMLLAACTPASSAPAASASTAPAAPPSAAASASAVPPAAPPAPAEPEYDYGKAITVVSREDGSGTRGAFIELFKILVDGKDTTTVEAVISNSTDVMMTNISGDEYAIGYISLGSLNDTVRALDIDGVEATAANVKGGSYTVSRPFNIAVKEGISDLAQDFVDYIMSKEGQSVIADGGYVAIDDAAAAYAGSKPAGKIVVGGSSSVTPIMEKLKEAYIAVNTGADIEIQMTDSSAGMMSAIEGTCDIGMASRELKDTEKAELTEITIAIDGIAVIVNNNHPMTNLTKDQVKSIFTGEALLWSDVQ